MMQAMDRVMPALNPRMGVCFIHACWITLYLLSIHVLMLAGLGTDGLAHVSQSIPNFAAQQGVPPEHAAAWAL